MSHFIWALVIVSRDGFVLICDASGERECDKRRTGLRDRAFVLLRDMGLVCFYDVKHLAVLSPFRTVIQRRK